jgi:OOP family OmpA-OmpF porin
MKRIFYSFAISCLMVVGAFSQKITTLSPYVERQSQAYVTITKVELTDSYTIMHFTYKNTRSISNRRGGRDMEELYKVFPEFRGLMERGTSTEWIHIDPRSRLYKPGDATKKFRFVRAEGIPISPDTLVVKPGMEVKFRVYFRRLDPGIEVFDMFEGDDRGSQQFWNFYGIHIRNPKTPPPATPKPQPETKKEEPPVVVEKPQTTPPPPAVETPAPTLVTVKGNIIDAKTKTPIAAKISYIVPSENNGLDSMQLSASSGKFKISLDAGNKYAYSASAKGYFPANGAFDLTQTKGGQEISNDILLTPIAVGEAITLNNIYFDVAKYDLLPASSAELNNLLGLMKENPNMEIRVEGHTDNLGDFDKNVELSQNRANAVKKYLVSKGIDSSRIEARGLGPTRPVTKGNSESERQRNRRVEFVIIKM